MKRWLLALALITAPVFAADLSVDTVVKTDWDGPRYELGVTAGTPAGVNLGFGLWGLGKAPILVRVYGGYIGIAGGAGGQVGWIFDREGDVLQYVALAGEGAAGYWPFTGHFGSWVGGGPRYGLFWKGFTLDVGLTIGAGTYSWLFFGSNRTGYVGPLPTLSVGYSVFL